MSLSGLFQWDEAWVYVLFRYCARTGKGISLPLDQVRTLANLLGRLEDHGKHLEFLQSIAEIRPHLEKPEAPDMFVVYRYPRDYPHNFVVRRYWVTETKPHEIGCERTPTCVDDDLEAARRSIPEGRINIGRMLGDDSAIVEVWV